MVVPPKHPKMIIFSRKSKGCWGNPPFQETPIFDLGQLESPHRWLQNMFCFPCWSYDTYRYHLPHQWFQVQRYFKMMTCRLADPATSLNHRNHSFWNRMKPLCNILWWLSCNRRVKHQSQNNLSGRSITSCGPPRFRDDLIGIARPRPMCEFTVVVGSVLDPFELRSKHPPKMENYLDLLEPIGALWFRKIIYCWCFTNWGTGSFLKIIYKVSKTSKRWLFVIFFHQQDWSFWWDVTGLPASWNKIWKVLRPFHLLGSKNSFNESASSTRPKV